MIRFAVTAFVIAGASLGEAQTLPDGKGKELVEKICVNCHGPEVIGSVRKTRERWTATVSDMIGRGASGSDEEFEKIIDYLSTKLAPPPKPDHPGSADDAGKTPRP